MPGKPFRDDTAKDKRKDKEEARETFSAEFRGYLNYTLSPEEKELAGQWIESSSLYEMLHYSVSDGVQFSLKWEYKQECYLASATQRRASSPNAGLVVTARAREPWLALARLLYILALLNKSERWEDVQPLADPDRW